ncbi:MAG: vitamin B12-dependent ribonucleotide reductase [Deltaproteobacteria bacterium]|nr:vitamin B12-dependent ribonucleotide reductase [Deltaproteobacteria bacterium]
MGSVGAVSGDLAGSKVKVEKQRGDKLPLTENAITVLERRYLKKNESGRPVEKVEDMFRRVARTIAEADLKHDPTADIKSLENEFYSMMTNLEFLPNSPTLMNAGRDLGQLSACFVLPVEDSMESIFESIKDTALIHKSGGGTGFDFSNLRPKNSVVASTKGVSSGPVSFMKVFDSATEAIKQGGTRRGANMGILRVDHPDIMEFITCKEDHVTLTNFNISVALTEDFMDAVEKDRDYSLVDPRSGEEVERLDARKVFDKITELAWTNGDPGIVFIDRMNRDNPTPKIGPIASTNPCGEQPLLPYESCNLGSINLSRMITGGKLDYAKLGSTVKKAVHYLDNVIDANKYPIDKIAKMTRANRKIGLGVMGFADMLIMLGIGYNSREGVDTADKIMGFIREKAREASVDLAEKRGAFPNFKGSIFDKGKNAVKIRNATTTTIAPTGTISIISACSSGVEPLFAISYVRNVMDNDELPEVNPLFERIAKKEGFYSVELMKKIAGKGSVQGMAEVPEHIRKAFVTSHDISPEWHIKMQAAFQKYTDNAVSKTINFHNDATVSDIEKAYMLAHKNGCKGITIYRDGSREGQVLSIKKEEKKEEKHEVHIHADEIVAPRERPAVTFGKTEKVATGCGSLFVTVNEDEEGLCEIFTRMGKSGGCINSHNEAIGRLVSLALRAGVKTESIMDQMRGVRCPMPLGIGKNAVLSCPDAIGQVLAHYVANGNGNSTAAAAENTASTHMAMAPLPEMTSNNMAQAEKRVDSIDMGVCPECPDCGHIIEFIEGCLTCRGCGYSKC